MKSNTDLEAIFAQAVELADPTRRSTYLDEACGEDTQLRNRVSRLLAANQRLVSDHLAESFMSEPAILNLPDDVVADPSSNENERRLEFVGVAGEQPGDRLGPDKQYRLLEVVGEGGMGTVFKAEQTGPMRRTVAVKLIKPGMDTKEVLRRFEAERQSLAMMSSPHIAQVFDAGVTEQGRPYFVMEWVNGQAITDYCNEQKLTTRERLELFIPVCRAIQHAHQKGVIHRDIKPSNILISTESIAGKSKNQSDRGCVPKIIDFGIAKAIDDLDTVGTAITQLGELVGSPAYMSPEQAAAERDIDTRSDVYSLGVLLYELLVGTPPFANGERTLTREELRNAIREETPSRPSDAFQALRDTVAKHETTVANDVAQDIALARNSTAKELQSQLRGELDWIVMRSLEKDPDRRYDTASSFADDVQRHLSNQPVEARPPTLSYLLRKFVSRHRVAVGALAAIATTILIASCITGWALYNTSQALSREKVETQTLQQHVAFVNRGLFAQADPLAEPNRNVTLRTVLDRAAQNLNQQTIDQPKVEASIRLTVGRAYFGLGEYDKSLVHLRRAKKLLGENSKPADRKTIEAGTELARVLLAAGKLEEAETEIYGLQEIATPSFEETDALLQSIRQLEATRLDAVGEHQQAEGILRDVLRIRKDSLGAEHAETYKAMANLAFALHSQQRLDEALELLNSAHSGLLQANDRWEPDALRVTANLATLHFARNERERAKAIYSATIPKLKRLLGNNHPQTLTARHALALIEMSSGETQIAANELANVLAQQTDQLGESHSSTLTTLHNLGLARKSLGDTVGAKQLLSRELDLRTATQGAGHPTTQQALSSLAFLHLEQAEFAEAAELYRGLVPSTSEDATIGSDTNAVIALIMLGYCELKTENFVDAAEHLERTQTATEDWVTNDWLRYIALSLLGEAYGKLDRRDDSESALLDAYDELTKRDQEIPLRWKPMGLRATVRRLAEFYESANSAELRAHAHVYREKLAELRDQQINASPAGEHQTENSTEEAHRRSPPTDNPARNSDHGKD